MFIDLTKTHSVRIPPQILCAVDLTSENRPAFNWAVRLARLSGADLLLVHAVSRSESFSTQALKRIRDFAEMRKTAEAQGVRVTLSVQHGRAAGVIALHAKSRNAQLIVLGSNGRTGWRRLKTPSIAEQVMRRVSVPVFVVPTDGDPREVPSSGQILCAVDFSTASNAALAEALRLTRAQEGRLTVLHVVQGLESSTTSRRDWHFAVPEYRDSLMSDAKRQLENALSSEDRTGVAVETRLVPGVPHIEVLRAASGLDAALVIVGASERRYGGWGSTTNPIVRAIKVPVLVVPPANVAADERPGVRALVPSAASREAAVS